MKKTIKWRAHQIESTADYMFGCFGCCGRWLFICIDNSYTVHPFKLCNSVVYSMSTELCNCHCNQFQNIVITSNSNLVPVSSPSFYSLVWWNLPLGLQHPTGRQGSRWNMVNGWKVLEAGSEASSLPSPCPWLELSHVALPEWMEKRSLSGHWGRRGKCAISDHWHRRCSKAFVIFGLNVLILEFLEFGSLLHEIYEESILI